MTTFPQAPLDLRVEMQLAGTWTDISTYVLQREGTSPAVTITRGRADESSQVNPASMTCVLNNRDGRFTVTNPTGPYYGQLTRNTPVRVSVPSQNPYLRLETDRSSYASTPNAAPLDITGDTDIQIEVHPTSYLQSALCSKSTPAGNQRSWLWEIFPDGTLVFFWWPDGVTQHTAQSTIPIPLGHIALRVTIAVATSTVTFYTAPTIAGPWTQLGAASTTGTSTSIFNSTAAVVVGDNSSCVNGAVFAFKLINGIGGTTVASPAFTAQTPGATSFNDAQGNTWTLAGTSEISQRDYRFHGEMSSLPVTWDSSGTDVTVPLTAGGMLRRLGQGNAPVYSPMKRGILTQSGTFAPVAYWPCEDLAGATAFGSALNGPLLQIFGSPNLAADSSFVCSLPLPTLNNSTWVGTVPAYTSNGNIIVRFLLKVNTEPATTGQPLIRLITTGTCTELTLSYYTGGALGLRGNTASNFTNVFDTGAVSFGIHQVPVWCSIEIQPQVGTLQSASITVLPLGVTTGSTFLANWNGTIGNVAGVQVNPNALFPDSVIGHIQVQSAWQSLYNLYQPLNAWQGELAANRFNRLCGENGFTARIVGPPSTSVAMGTQSANTLPALLQEIEDTDRGQMFEARRSLAIGYRTQAALLNQASTATVNYSTAQLGGEDLKPTYDDQFTRNDLTVQRSSGSVSGASYRYVLNDGSVMSIGSPPAGVGDYSNSISVNVQADTQLPDEAGWQVHIGTVNESRWPTVPVNMARSEITAIFYQLQGIDIGDYLTVTQPLSQLAPDPIRQLVWGVREDLGGYFYQLLWNCVPESPYETGIYDDLVHGRADTDGSTLAAGVTSTATTLSVATTNATSPLWTTAAADFPFDIAVGGERMTVTNITGASSPQTFTVTRSVNTVVKAQTSGADVRLWFPPIFAML